MFIPLFDTLANLNHTQPMADIQYPDDFRLAKAFLYSYRGSEATFNAYRRKIERLLHWIWEFQDKSIRYISRTAFEAFVGFCQRHTGISEDVKRHPREHVRDDAGHGSIAITDRYVDVELQERHASARKKKIKPD